MLVQRDRRCPPPAGEGLKVQQDVVGVNPLLLLVAFHIYQVKDHRGACLLWQHGQSHKWHFVKQAACTAAAGTGTIPGHPQTAVDRRCANPATAVRQCRLASRHDPREPGYGGGSHAQKLCGEVGCVACVSSACSPQLDVVAGGGGEAAGRRGAPAAGLRWPLAAWPRAAAGTCSCRDGSGVARAATPARDLAGVAGASARAGMATTGAGGTAALAPRLRRDCRCLWGPHPCRDGRGAP